MAKIICEVEDDDGIVCGRVMSEREFDQDGKCWRCACAVSDFRVALCNDREPPRFLHSETAKLPD